MQRRLIVFGQKVRPQVTARVPFARMTSSGSGAAAFFRLESASNKSRSSQSGRSAMRSVIWTCVLLLTNPGLSITSLSASQNLTTCTALSRSLNLLKGRTQKVPGTAPARSTVEYHIKTKTDANVKLTNSGLKLDIYSLRPSTLVATSVNAWSGHFSSGTEFVVVIKNCSGKASSKFQLEISSN